MAATGGVVALGDLSGLEKVLGEKPSSDRMPAMFVGHGTPMNAIEDNQYSRKWAEIGASLPKPRAIVSVSAHWLTNGTKVTAMPRPKTIHDFGGFPQALFDVQYSAPGEPQLAQEASTMLAPKYVSLDEDWGFDHGTWSVLRQMYPKADIPVIQLSLDYSAPIQEHLDLAKKLQGLRDRGVLVLGSGNVVHNLRALSVEGKKFDWATEFDHFVEKNLLDKNDQALVDFQKLGSVAKMAHPTYEHYLPLLYVAGIRDAKDKLAFFNEGIDYGSISMRSFVLQN